MERCRKWYLDPEQGGLDATSELEYYIRDLYHNHLKDIDIELYRHLERHHILPQVYGVRCRVAPHLGSALGLFRKNKLQWPKMYLITCLVMCLMYFHKKIMLSS